MLKSLIGSEPAWLVPCPLIYLCLGFVLSNLSLKFSEIGYIIHLSKCFVLAFPMRNFYKISPWVGFVNTFFVFFSSFFFGLWFAFFTPQSVVFGLFFILF